MTKRTKIILWTALVCAATAAGLMLCFMRQEKEQAETPDTVWSIGIYTGASPVTLSSPCGITNPVLTAGDVTDARALFVADPFMVRKDSMWYMFFEVYNIRSGKGEIGCATSGDALHWSYMGLVLAEPFHLSFPYVFEWNGAFYMIPESRQSGTVRLYKAVDFPVKWTLQGVLLNEDIADPAVVRHNGKWWLFGKSGFSTLRLYYADSLAGPWTEHPRSPVVRWNRVISRPGGRVIEIGDKLIRYAQDGTPSYGSRVWALEITKLTTTEYEEQKVSRLPVVQGSGAGWNATGMHTVDPHRLSDGTWIACVDGREPQLNRRSNAAHGSRKKRR